MRPNLIAYKKNSRWYLYAQEEDYPNKPAINKSFTSRRQASKFLENLTIKGVPFYFSANIEEEK